MKADSQETYSLLDSGRGQKYESFGPHRIIRPCGQAAWQEQYPQSWSKRHASFTRDQQQQSWKQEGTLPESWVVSFDDVKLRLKPTDFGHLGVFPEHLSMCQWMKPKIKEHIKKTGEAPRILNLFAYSGLATLSAAKAGAELCHVDAAKGMIDWAKENAALNALEDAPIRWIVEDVTRFLRRELRRGNTYDGIILDPPTFGRGKKGEVFKIEGDLIPLLELCRDLLSPQALFLILTCHTPGYTPIILENIVSQLMQDKEGSLEKGEMLLKSEGKSFDIPSGSYARWFSQ